MNSIFKLKLFVFGIYRVLAIALVGGGLLGLSGCAADGHLISLPEAVANSRWTGRPINEALAKWGRPTGGVRHAEDGTTIYIWSMGQSRTYGLLTGSNTQLVAGGSLGGTLVTTNQYEEHTDTLGCTLLINANSKGIITHFETITKFNGCAGFYHGPSAP
jgi:hypothetical protein